MGRVQQKLQNTDFWGSREGLKIYSWCDDIFNKSN